MAPKTPRGDEAAAIAAAIARFEAEHAGGAPTETEPAVGAWQRVALLEGVSAKEPVEDPGGGSQWLS